MEIIAKLAKVKFSLCYTLVNVVPDLAKQTKSIFAKFAKVKFPICYTLLVYITKMDTL